MSDFVITGFGPADEGDYLIARIVIGGVATVVDDRVGSWMISRELNPGADWQGLATGREVLEPFKYRLAEKARAHRKRSSSGAAAPMVAA